MGADEPVERSVLECLVVETPRHPKEGREAANLVDEGGGAGGRNVCVSLHHQGDVLEGNWLVRFDLLFLGDLAVAVGFGFGVMKRSRRVEPLSLGS